MGPFCPRAVLLTMTDPQVIPHSVSFLHCFDRDEGGLLGEQVEGLGIPVPRASPSQGCYGRYWSMCDNRVCTPNLLASYSERLTLYNFSKLHPMWGSYKNMVCGSWYF